MNKEIGEEFPTDSLSGNYDYRITLLNTKADNIAKNYKEFKKEVKTMDDRIRENSNKLNTVISDIKSLKGDINEISKRLDAHNF